MTGRPTATGAGTIDVGGDLTVNRMGFGAMRITGPGIWGDPPDRERAKAALRRAVGKALISASADETRRGLRRARRTTAQARWRVRR